MITLVLLACFLGASSAHLREYVTLPGIQGSSYSLSNATYLTWEDAGHQCRQDGGHLAIIDSQEELDAVVQFRASQGIDMFLSWAGFHDRFTEGDYVTMLDEPLPFSVWYPGYPYDSDEVNCGGVLSLNGQTGLVIYSCHALRTFICERSAA
ncbi:hypothetical protein C0J52_11049 [Blattella germanica]|nr:hypothetical protein C0J52_11049 [Blattella germanica]